MVVNLIAYVNIVFLVCLLVLLVVSLTAQMLLDTHMHMCWDIVAILFDNSLILSLNAQSDCVLLGFRYIIKLSTQLTASRLPERPEGLTNLALTKQIQYNVNLYPAYCL